MSDQRFTKGRWTVAVSGLDLVFKVLCFIAKLMIYRMAMDKPIDGEEKNELMKDLEVIKYGEDW